jgi:hypothetical protein
MQIHRLRRENILTTAGPATSLAGAHQIAIINGPGNPMDYAQRPIDNPPSSVEMDSFNWNATHFKRTGEEMTIAASIVSSRTIQSQRIAWWALSVLRQVNISKSHDRRREVT